MAQSSRGFLLIADISGYSVYLSASELEHARDTLSALLEVLVEGSRPPLVVSKLEGDAVLSYCEDGDLLAGQTLVEMVESTYVAFRRAIELMVLNNTCGCNACANVSTLDLKFFVHHGDFATQHIGRHIELVGRDVNIAHRLLKNSVRERTGMLAYAAFTAAAIERLGEDLAEGLTRVEEVYDDVGEIAIWVQDMHPVWETRRDQPIVDLSVEKTDVEIEVEIALPAEVVWDYLADVEFRRVIIGSDSQEVVDRRRGRVDVGSTYLCYHGDRIVKQLILEWRPFERMVSKDRIGGILGDLYVLDVFELRPQGETTLLTQKAGGFTGPPIRRTIAPLIIRMMKGQFLRDAERFRDVIEKNHRERMGKLSPSPSRA